MERIGRRGFMKVSAAVLAGSLLPEVSFGSASKQTEKKPNVVFFLIDDMGWKDLGCFGAKLYETPHIDKLCAEGMRFHQAYTSTAICAPARATALTGIHPVKLHMWNHVHYIPKGQKILPAYLKEAGYQTWHVGKWHMGNPEDKTMPTDLGFDVDRGGWISWEPGSYFWPYGCDEEGKPIRKRCGVPGLFEGGKEGEYLTDRLGDEAVKLIERGDRGKPFYLNFWHYAVHNPKQAKEELVRKYERKIERLGLKETYRYDEKTGSKLLTSETNAVYAAMIESIDDSVGKVVAKLKETGQYDNTLFIFYSDNGSTTDTVPCVPLNGGKNSTYEGGNRLPGFATWKGHIKPGTEYARPMYIGDVFYTVLDAAGVKAPSNYENDGVTWLPVFAGGELEKREFIWYFPDTRLMYAQRANAAIYDEKTGMKYIMFFTGDEDEMYDIHNDLAEERNIIDEHRDLAEKMREKMVAFLSKYYGTLPGPPKKYRKMVEKRLEIQ